MFCSCRDHSQFVCERCERARELKLIEDVFRIFLMIFFRRSFAAVEIFCLTSQRGKHIKTYVCLSSNDYLSADLHSLTRSRRCLQTQFAPCHVSSPFLGT